MATPNLLFAVVKREDLAIAHRQWIRANKLKEHFQTALSKTTKEENEDPMRFYLTDAGTLLLVWYGMLFTVMELLKSKGVALAALDPNFDELYSALRRLRNSVFHAEKTYWDDRQIEVMQLDEAVKRIHHVHDTLGELFLDAMRNWETKQSS
jgi:biopolymer transport protein ExbD